uniref:Uncharacterized protein n=1 Tax=Arundo donax TaxID=35708 RepID=A0A0A8YDF2_ARUDO
MTTSTLGGTMIAATAPIKEHNCCWPSSKLGVNSTINHHRSALQRHLHQHWAPSTFSLLDHHSSRMSCLGGVM